MRIGWSKYSLFRRTAIKDRESPRSNDRKEVDLEGDNETLLRNTVDRFTLFPIVDHDVSTNTKPNRL